MSRDIPLGKFGVFSPPRFRNAGVDHLTGIFTVHDGKTAVIAQTVGMAPDDLWPIWWNVPPQKS
jgi:hypothetical protein